MHLFFVSGQGWRGLVMEYIIAGKWSCLLRYQTIGIQVGSAHQVFTDPCAFEQFCDELDLLTDEGFPMGEVTEADRLEAEGED